MSEQQAILARARSDADDALLRADEPLDGLQRRCGGSVPGLVAIPALLALVRRSRRSGRRVGGAITAQDGSDLVTAWVEVEPLRSGGEEGCDIHLLSWQSTPIPPEDGAAAEQRRHALDRHLAELCVQLDAQQRVLAVTCDAADLTEAAHALEAGIGRSWVEVLVPENVTHQQPLHWRLLDGVRVTVPGSQRRWRVALVPRQRPGFDPSGFEMLLLSDEPAQAAPAPAEPAPEPARRSVVGQDIAPALRQPIARIIANAETIRTRLAGPLPEAYADYAGEIASAGKLLLDLLDDLADLEVVESADFTTVPEPIDLSEVARQAAGILGVRAREKSIRIDVPAADQTLPAVAEFRRVLQVLLNLIGNAIRYAPDHSQIWISLEGHAGRAQVVVADQGPGLSEDQQARIFEKFERLGRSGDGGSGLGLYISRSLARAMGGDLSVESAPGQGARFILELPAEP